jgi:hypothetical protein
MTTVKLPQMNSLTWPGTWPTHPTILPERVGPVGVFLHDSNKSYVGMLRNWRLAWAPMSLGAVLFLDDIHPHNAYLDFVDAWGRPECRP